MDKLEKIVDVSLRGIGVLCLLFAAASPIIALVMLRADILIGGVIFAFLYVALVDTANKLKELNEPIDTEEVIDSVEE